MRNLSLIRFIFYLFFFLIPFLSIGKKTDTYPVKVLRISVLPDTVQTTKKNTGSETKDGKGKIIKTVPKSRRQTKPVVVPKVIKVKPNVKTKINIPLKIKVSL